MVTPILRFHALVVLFTVGLMFIMISNIPQGLTATNFISKVSIPLVGAASSIGIYFFLSKLLIWLLKKFNWILKLMLGPYYIKGTWVGKIITKKGKPCIFFEHYDQTLNSLVIRGWSFTTEGIQQADWSTVSAHIEPIEGAIYCHYRTNIPHRNSPVEGVGRLQFDREKETIGPRGMSGYCIDSYTTKKLIYEDMVKVSEKLIPKKDALHKAMDFVKVKKDGDEKSEESSE